MFNKFIYFTHFIIIHPNAPSQLKEEVNTQFDENSDMKLNKKMMLMN